MLPKSRRIRSARDHRDIWRRGRVLRGKYMVVRFRPRQGATSRFGFVVSTAIAKHAVVRNTIKRRLRSAAHEMATSEADAVIYATKAAVTADYQQLKAELQHLLPAPRANYTSLHH